MPAGMGPTTHGRWLRSRSPRGFGPTSNGGEYERNEEAVLMLERLVPFQLDPDPKTR